MQGSSRPNELFSGFWSAENHFVRNKTGVFTRFKQTKWAIFLHLVCFFAKKQTESRRSAQTKRPAHFQSGKKKQQKRPLPMALPTVAHSIKKHPAEQGAISRVVLTAAIKQPSRLRRPWRMLPDRRRRGRDRSALYWARHLRKRLTLAYIASLRLATSAHTWPPP